MYDMRALYRKKLLGTPTVMRTSDEFHWMAFRQRVERKITKRNAPSSRNERQSTRDHKHLLAEKGPPITDGHNQPGRWLTAMLKSRVAKLYPI